MKAHILKSCIPVLALFFITGCGEKEECDDHLHKVIPAPYAIYAEYAHGSNKLMGSGMNRRVFDSVEAQSGTDIQLLKGDSNAGCITLEHGRYRITGFSVVTMQTTVAPPVAKDTNTYPGYAVAYPPQYEDATMQVLLNHSLAIGGPSTAYGSTPSLFDFVVFYKEKTTIAIGHQAGHDLHDEVYLSIYDVGGTKSNYHAFARVAITKIGDE